MLSRLLRQPGVDEVLVLRSARTGFLALHGGSQDRMTDVIATRAADLAAASLYAIVQPASLRWHIPSAQHDPRDSEKLAAFLAHVDVAISVHGYGADGWWFDDDPPEGHRAPDVQRCVDANAFLVGGGNRGLAARAAAAIRGALPHYSVIDDIEEIPGSLRGTHPRNPVNLTRAGGVQVEVPPRPRGLRGGDVAEIHVLAQALASTARS